MAKFEGHTGPVKQISFSENGYHMASAAKDGIRIWDLRKLKSIKEITPYYETGEASCVSFDYSGNYLVSNIHTYRILYT